MKRKHFNRRFKNKKQKVIFCYHRTYKRFGSLINHGNKLSQARLLKSNWGFGQLVKKTFPDSYPYILAFRKNHSFFNLIFSSFYLKQSLSFISVLISCKLPILALFAPGKYQGVSLKSFQNFFLGNFGLLSFLLSKKTNVSFFIGKFPPGFITNYRTVSHKFFNKNFFPSSFLSFSMISVLLSTESESVGVPFIFIKDSNEVEKKMPYPIPGNSNSIKPSVFFLKLFFAVVYHSKKEKVENFFPSSKFFSSRGKHKISKKKILRRSSPVSSSSLIRSTKKNRFKNAGKWNRTTALTFSGSCSTIKPSQ